MVLCSVGQVASHGFFEPSRARVTDKQVSFPAGGTYMSIAAPTHPRPVLSMLTGAPGHEHQSLIRVQV